MIYKIISVYDSKAEVYERPFFARSTGEAVRSFGDEVNSGSEASAICHHPEDFILYELGTWDAAAGRIDVLDKPRALNSGIDLKRAPAARAVS